MSETQVKYLKEVVDLLNYRMHLLAASIQKTDFKVFQSSNLSPFSLKVDDSGTFEDLKILNITKHKYDMLKAKAEGYEKLKSIFLLDDD
jgi:hypothetical protein